MSWIADITWDDGSKDRLILPPLEGVEGGPEEYEQTARTVVETFCPLWTGKRIAHYHLERDDSDEGS